mgnify:FL=1
MMANIPKKVNDRFIKQTAKFQKVIKQAVDRDINETDTVKIIADILSDLFGYDRYTEITGEYAIKGTFCDLAIKVDDKTRYLIEVKAVSTDLKENHLRQAINYGAREGIQWVILTNGLIWKGYSVSLKQSVTFEQVFELEFLGINPRKKEDQQKLFLLAKEGLSKDVIADYHERLKCVNPYVISAILMSKPSIDLIKRELRKLSRGLKIEDTEIESLLANDIFKRQVTEGENSKIALKLIKKAANKSKKNTKEKMNVQLNDRIYQEG